jgi:hypothetical protein
VISGVAELKIAILRTLARAYFHSGSYDRAEAALEELIPSIDVSTEHASPEYQELRWLRLAVLKRRKAGDPALFDAFKSIIDRMKMSETSITLLVTGFFFSGNILHCSPHIAFCRTFELSAIDIPLLQLSINIVSSER